MLRGKDVHMAMIGDGRVDLGGGNGAMSKKMLDVADVDALLQEEGRNRVAEHVRGQMVRKASLSRVATEHGSDGLLRETAAEAVVEEEGVR